MGEEPSGSSSQTSKPPVREEESSSSSASRFVSSLRCFLLIFAFGFLGFFGFGFLAFLLFPHILAARRVLRPAPFTQHHSLNITHSISLTLISLTQPNITHTNITYSTSLNQYHSMQCHSYKYHSLNITHPISLNSISLTKHHSTKYHSPEITQLNISHPISLNSIPLTLISLTQPNIPNITHTNITHSIRHTHITHSTQYHSLNIPHTHITHTHITHTQHHSTQYHSHKYHSLNITHPISLNSTSPIQVSLKLFHTATSQCCSIVSPCHSTENAICCSKIKTNLIYNRTWEKSISPGTGPIHPDVTHKIVTSSHKLPRQPIFLRRKKANTLPSFLPRLEQTIHVGFSGPWICRDGFWLVWFGLSCFAFPWCFFLGPGLRLFLIPRR